MRVSLPKISKISVSVRGGAGWGHSGEAETWKAGQGEGPGCEPCRSAAAGGQGIYGLGAAAPPSQGTPSTHQRGCCGGTGGSSDVFLGKREPELKTQR